MITLCRSHLKTPGSCCNVSPAPNWSPFHCGLEAAQTSCFYSKAWSEYGRHVSDHVWDCVSSETGFHFCMSDIISELQVINILPRTRGHLAVGGESEADVSSFFTWIVHGLLQNGKPNMACCIVHLLHACGRSKMIRGFDLISQLSLIR